MKILEMLLTLFSSHGTSFLKSNTEALSQQVVNYARRVAILLALTVISITLFCSGFSMGYGGLVSGFERSEGWVWSPHLIAGLILTAISTAGLIYSLGEKRWLAAADLDEPAAKQAAAPSPMEGAIAALLIELAGELKSRRERASAQAPTEAPTSHP